MLTAPVDAVAQPVLLAFETVPVVDGAPAGFQLVNQAFRLTAYQEGVPLSHFQFQQPVTLTLDYRDEQMQGVDELTLAFAFFDESAGQWSTDGITVVERDLDHNRLVVQLTHLTTFALLASTLTAGPTPTPGPALYLPLIRRAGFKSRPQVRHLIPLTYCASRYCIKAGD